MPQDRRSKYHATPTTVDGIRFHSAKEARRYQELKLLEKAGEISQLELQPPFALWAPLTRRGVTPDGRLGMRQVGTYVADFSYMERYGSGDSAFVVEDVKGFKTPLYRWKKRHVEAQYGITIREV